MNEQFSEKFHFFIFKSFLIFYLLLIIIILVEKKYL